MTENRKREGTLQCSPMLFVRVDSVFDDTESKYVFDLLGVHLIVVTITGPRGIGKTTLAKKILDMLRREALSVQANPAVATTPINKVGFHPYDYVVALDGHGFAHGPPSTEGPAVGRCYTVSAVTETRIQLRELPDLFWDSAGFALVHRSAT